MGEKADARKMVCTNRRARRDYFIVERLEAGLALRGTEVKSLREGRVELREAYVAVEGGEAFLVDAHIAPWPGAAYFNHQPLRRRKLLLKAKEIARLRGQIDQKGFTAVPLSIYFNEKNLAKVEIGVGRGRKQIDKRELIRLRDEERQQRNRRENG